jgi:hypothetical protein
MKSLISLATILLCAGIALAQEQVPRDWIAEWPRTSFQKAAVVFFRDPLGRTTQGRHSGNRRSKIRTSGKRKGQRLGVGAGAERGCRGFGGGR